MRTANHSRLHLPPAALTCHRQHHSKVTRKPARSFPAGTPAPAQASSLSANSVKVKEIVFACYCPPPAGFVEAATGIGMSMMFEAGDLAGTASAFLAIGAGSL